MYMSELDSSRLDLQWPSGYMMPGSQACVRRFESPLAWSLYKCAALCRAVLMVFLQLKDPLDLFIKRRKFLPSFGFLSHCDMT